MPDRSRDWLEQASRDLDLARKVADDGFHEWACFAAHQAAEKALKALHLHLGQEAWGHVVRRLVEDLPASVAIPDGLVDKARVLDGYYIPTRYPNGHPAGSPGEHYGELQSEDAIRHAGETLEFVRLQMA